MFFECWSTPKSTATHGASPCVPFVASNTQARQIMRALGGGQSRRPSPPTSDANHRQIVRALGGDQTARLPTLPVSAASAETMSSSRSNPSKRRKFG